MTSNYYAQSLEEAEARFQQYKSKDPFPEILPALLNSADICDYVAATGMIYPFNPKPSINQSEQNCYDNLKPASYAIPILGKLVYWDKDGKKCSKDIKQNERFILEQNSIAFVTLEPTFHLPDYIALRFNLKIKHIYRGILLGTGPLVDPGFVGKLSIPLHNLTTNDYTFKGGEDLIWIEFTKLSPLKLWYQTNENTSLINYQPQDGLKKFYTQGSLIRYRRQPLVSLNRQGGYARFPHKKSLDDVEDYLDKASPHRSIQSSIPQTFREAEKASKDAQGTIKVFQSIGFIGAIALFVALVALGSQINSLVEDSVTYVKNAPVNQDQIETTIEKLKDEVIENEYNKIQQLEDEIYSLKKEIEELKQNQSNPNKNDPNENGG